MKINFVKTRPDAVIPKADDHVNLHNYCMHLWSEWDAVNREVSNAE